MYFSPSSSLAVSIGLITVVSGISIRDLTPQSLAHRTLLPRANHLPRANRPPNEPETGDDLPDTEPHPNHLDQVETGFNDAIELTSYVLFKIDNDNDIFPHYFNPADRAEVKKIFATINNGDQGNEMLKDILVQSTDSNNLCDGKTLSYLKNGEKDATETPYLVLCPNAFNKKAVTLLNGAEPEGDEKHYATCDDIGADGHHVTYKFNTLGMTLLHEYMHYDKMIDSSFGPIIDYADPDESKPQGYGPYNVYDRLDKSLARTNADSYAYYASHVLWDILCQFDFQAPRAGTDDNDPDCSDGTCSQ